ncbi:GNAT family N-acetyltransferase [Pseudoxanthomonas dokdonensis]|uniref:Acyltransferase superfamily protein n=1 Tax=Pseudoxanthomonas dokdonensis TaxID=344882 RepID=A0A0R0CLQ3_9GAMM|nr:GNAT family N-acetyltransferase [Pseudoxanthomonas dokdonensis]KRG70491.1 hypothetical protein ABB29_05240 [Pseudoxanthomonas dokdonensis]
MTGLRVLADLSAVPAAQWDALHEGQPFVSHAFLSGLENCGCLRPDWGWTPQHLTLWQDGQLLAAAPGYLKTNSHGEFVFDHAWAHAYAQHGMDYFPKWLCAVPYSPVTGPRLLAPDPAHRALLLRAIVAHGQQLGLSSAHINFHREGELGTVSDDWLPRHDLQYHWRNLQGWVDFDDFLAGMDHKHRKNIRQERQKVTRAGVSFRVVHGDQAAAGDIAAMHGFYLQTFAEYGNSPALTLPFFQHLANQLGRQLVMFLAMDDGHAIAGALCLRDDTTLYGRYWGSEVTLAGLHFETCYYQGIEYCLRENLVSFEPGAQGEHKIARGFLPTLVRSHHWIADPMFRNALKTWCSQESDLQLQRMQVLANNSPFK